MDDDDVSQHHSGRKSAGGEALTRCLREVVYDTLPSQLSELAVPAPRAQLLAVILIQQGKSCLTHPSLMTDIIVDSSVVSLLEGVVLLVLDRWARQA
jgi:hypothetical protein